MPDNQYDVLVIGAGPGGYVAAIRAAQRGLRTACVDPNDMLGGTCLRVGCIPSKALLESSNLVHTLRHGTAAHGVRVGEIGFDLAAMMARKDKILVSLSRGIESLFRKHGVTRLTGTARLAEGVVVIDGPDAGSVSAERVLLAAGSRPADVPGVVIDGERVVTSTGALEFRSVPEHLVVLGAGAIGLELGSVWQRLGAKVTVIELLDRILPNNDAEVAAAAQKLYARQGFTFRLGSRITSARATGSGCLVETESDDPLPCDRVLVAIGRRANGDALGLGEAGVETDDRGRVLVGERYETSVPGLFAIGDLIPGPMLAHRAEFDAVACVDAWFGEPCERDYSLVPAVVYTEPEVAGVGRTEAQLQSDGVAYRKGVSLFRPNGRARAMEQPDGLLKVLCGEQGELLGVHVVGPLAGELIAEATVALRLGATAADIGHTSHAHPTLAEVFREACLASIGEAVNQ